MCGYIITEIIPFRRIVHDACLELISDKNIAEKIYDYIMQPIEDYLYDECEYFEMVKCKNCEHHDDNYCPKVDSLTEDNFYCGWGKEIDD